MRSSGKTKRFIQRTSVEKRADSETGPRVPGLVSDRAQPLSVLEERADNGDRPKRPQPCFGPRRSLSALEERADNGGRRERSSPDVGPRRSLSAPSGRGSVWSSACVAQRDSPTPKLSRGRRERSAELVTLTKVPRNNLQLPNRLFDLAHLVRILPQKLIDLPAHPQRHIELGIRTRDIRAEVDQILTLPQQSHRLPQLLGRQLLFGR